MYGDFQYEMGQTYIHEGRIVPCMFGFHASKEIRDAVRHCSGDHLVEVELGGNIIEAKDEVVASEITILRELDLIKELETLSKDEDWRIREAVARNPNTPVKIFKKLARDKDACVRRGIIENPNAPFKIRRALNTNEFWDVSTWQQIVKIVRSMINI